MILTVGKKKLYVTTGKVFGAYLFSEANENLIFNATYTTKDEYWKFLCLQYWKGTMGKSSVKFIVLKAFRVKFYFENYHWRFLLFIYTRKSTLSIKCISFFRDFLPTSLPFSSFSVLYRTFATTPIFELKIILGNYPRDKLVNLSSSTSLSHSHFIVDFYLFQLLHIFK